MKNTKKSADRCLRVIPLWEFYIYITVHISVVIYILYCVYIASNKYDGLLNLYDFDAGWSFIAREKDISNFEWHFFFNFFWSILPWYIAYIAMDWIASHHVSAKNRRHICLLSSIVLLTYILGWKPLLLQFSHCMVMFLVTLLQSKVAIWILSVLLISTLNFEPFISWMRALNPDDLEGKSYYILMFTLALVHLRYTSFCLERVQYFNNSTESKDRNLDSNQQPDMYMEQRKEEVNTQEELEYMRFSFLDAFTYIFYFPLFFTGPIITYDEFSKQMNELSLKPLGDKKIISIVFLALRMVFWTYFIEFILHFFYFNALQHNLSVIEDMDLWTLAGMGYCQGQFFMVKYIVMFGIPAVVARICGIDPPAGPKCVAHIYTYSDMWKYFDRGMYSFIKRYIYIPLGGSQGNFLKKLICSMACFAFVYIWHGIEYYVFLWTLFNFIGISLEVLGHWIDKQSVSQQWKQSMPALFTRLHAVIIIPLFIMSVFTAFCFFGGSVVGYLFYEKFVLQGTLKSWTTVSLILYCCIQSSMKIHEWQKRKEKKI